MHDRVLQGLLFAMVIAQTWNATVRIITYVKKTMANEPGGEEEDTSRSAPPWKRSALHWAACVAVCMIAMVPALYYGAEATLT